MNGATVSTRTIAAIAALGAVSLLTGFVVAIFGEPSPSVRSANADSFSRSAIGHRAFVELLRQTGRRVVVSRSGSAERANRDGVLLALEPLPDEADRLAAMLEIADRALVVLPKWDGYESDVRAGWLHEVATLDPDDVEEVLAAVGVDGVVRRIAGPFLADGLDEPPALVRPQLVDTNDLEPVLESDDGVLLGWRTPREDARHWVLTDPDLLQNHGISDGPNAALALSLIERIAGTDDVLVIDETLHGHEIAPHVWGALGRFPLSLALLQGAVTIAALLWFAGRRLGTPMPQPPALRPGRMTLVDSTAELLMHGGHSPSILARYLDIEERRVGAARNVPRSFDADARRAELRRIEDRRQPSVRLDDVVAAVERAGHETTGREARIAAAARSVHAWRTEMMHGAQ